MSEKVTARNHIERVLSVLMKFVDEKNGIAVGGTEKVITTTQQVNHGPCCLLSNSSLKFLLMCFQQYLKFW